MAGPGARQVLIEGYSVDEIMALPGEQLDQFVFCGEPIVFRAGSASILGSFERTPDRIILELGHIDGGGEGGFRVRQVPGVGEWYHLVEPCAAPGDEVSQAQPSTATSTRPS